MASPMDRMQSIPSMSKSLKANRGLSAFKKLTGLLVIIIAIAFILALTATKAEETNSFCIACHTAPEQTYFDRAAAAHDLEIVDLASAHSVEHEDFKCIDCHRGESTLTDRATTLALGARDTLIFISGQADQTIEKGHATQPDLLNRACWQCHQEAVTQAGFNNHFHNKLAVTDSSQPSSSAVCTDCHRAHIQMDSGSEQGFLNIEGVVYLACEKCHHELERGPQTLAP